MTLTELKIDLWLTSYFTCIKRFSTIHFLASYQNKSYWGIEIPLLMLRNFWYSMNVLAKLDHLTGLVSNITAWKFIFIEHTEMCLGIDLFLENKYKPVAKKINLLAFLFALLKQANLYD